MKLSFKQLEKRFTPMPTYRVNIPWDHLEENLQRYIDRGSNGTAALDLEPDFQREHVWTPEQQVKYVEYILSGGMSGREIYFNCVGWMKDWKGPFVIVDGKQRLHAARLFMDNKLQVFGKKVEVKPCMLAPMGGEEIQDGYFRKDIEGRLSLNAQFIFAVNDLKTRAEVLKWYLEMNTGGTPHTATEIARVKNLLTSEAPQMPHCPMCKGEVELDGSGGYNCFFCGHSFK